MTTTTSSSPSLNGEISISISLEEQIRRRADMSPPPCCIHTSTSATATAYKKPVFVCLYCNNFTSTKERAYSRHALTKHPEFFPYARELELRLNGGRKTEAIEIRKNFKTYAEWRDSDECKEWDEQRKIEYTKWLSDNNNKNNNNKSSQQNTNNNAVQVKIRSKYHIINNKDTKKGHEFIPEQPPANDLDLIPRSAGSTLSAENKRQFDETREEHLKFERLKENEKESSPPPTSSSKSESKEENNKEIQKNLSRESSKDYIRNNDGRIKYVDD